MHNYMPEGSADDFVAALASEEVFGSSLGQLKQKVLETPEDLNARLALLGRMFRCGANSVRKHLLWLIDNHPKHSAHQFIVLRKATSTYNEARQHWLRHLNTQSDDVTILFHAGVFFSILAPNDSMRLFQKAADLDPTNDEFTRKLSHVCATMAASGSTTRHKLFAHNAAQQMLITVERYMRPSTLDSYMLPYFPYELSDIAELAMQFDLLEDARQLGQLLLKHRSINLERLNKINNNADIYSISECFGHSILGRVALASGQINAAKEQLRCMMQLPVGQRSDWSLANALLQIGETQIVCEYIEYFGNRLRDISTTNASINLSAEDSSFINQKQKLLKKWLKEIRTGNIPTLY